MAESGRHWVGKAIALVSFPDIDPYVKNCSRTHFCRRKNFYQNRRLRNHRKRIYSQDYFDVRIIYWKLTQNRWRKFRELEIRKVVRIT
jgi:hypothetical protein